MAEAGAAPLEPRTSEEGGSRRGNTGTRSAPHPHQSGLRSDTMVLLGPPACKWEGLGASEGQHPPAQLFASVSQPFPGLSFPMCPSGCTGALALL